MAKAKALAYPEANPALIHLLDCSSTGASRLLRRSICHIFILKMSHIQSGKTTTNPTILRTVGSMDAR
jgi:hypothetical protein